MLLLACEEPSHGLSHSQSYHNALVLYVTAALCEHMSNDILQGIGELCLLLEAISAIVGCHAHFVSDDSAGRNRGGLLLVPAACPDLEELPGGSISLSIVFGLLSALLGKEREVRCCQVLCHSCHLNVVGGSFFGENCNKQYA